MPFKLEYCRDCKTVHDPRFCPKDEWPKHRDSGDYCGKCGQHWMVHNDDGSCVIDEVNE